MWMAILDRLANKDLSEEGLSQQKHAIWFWDKDIIGKGKSKYKDPKVGKRLVYLRNKKANKED